VGRWWGGVGWGAVGWGGVGVPLSITNLFTVELIINM